LVWICLFLFSFVLWFFPLPTGLFVFLPVYFAYQYTLFFLSVSFSFSFCYNLQSHCLDGFPRWFGAQFPRTVEFLKMSFEGPKFGNGWRGARHHLPRDVVDGERLRSFEKHRDLREILQLFCRYSRESTFNQTHFLEEGGEGRGRRRGYLTQMISGVSRLEDQSNECSLSVVLSFNPTSLAKVVYIVSVNSPRSFCPSTAAIAFFTVSIIPLPSSSPPNPSLSLFLTLLSFLSPHPLPLLLTFVDVIIQGEGSLTEGAGVEFFLEWL
jgi:hypothetical protein